MNDDIKPFDFNDEATRKKWVESLEKSILQMRKDIEEQREREKNDPPDRVRHEYDDIFWVPKVKEYWIKDEKYPAAHIAQGWYAGFSEEKIKETMECKDNPQTVDLAVCIVAHDMIPELIEKLQKIYDDNKDIK